MIKFQRTTRSLSIVVVTLLICLIDIVECGCRIQERNQCETVCQWNSTTQNYDCNLRAIIILPKMDKVEASLPRVSVKQERMTKFNR